MRLINKQITPAVKTRDSNHFFMGELRKGVFGSLEGEWMKCELMGKKMVTVPKKNGYCPKVTRLFVARGGEGSGVFGEDAPSG